MLLPCQARALHHLFGKVGETSDRGANSGKRSEIFVFEHEGRLSRLPDTCGRRLGISIIADPHIAPAIAQRTGLCGRNA